MADWKTRVINCQGNVLEFLPDDLKQIVFYTEHFKNPVWNDWYGVHCPTDKVLMILAHSEYYKYRLQSLNILECKVIGGAYKKKGVYHIQAQKNTPYIFIQWLMGKCLIPWWREDLLEFLELCARYLVPVDYILYSFEICIGNDSFLNWVNFRQGLYFLHACEHGLKEVYYYLLVQIGYEVVPKGLKQFTPYKKWKKIV